MPRRHVFCKMPSASHGRALWLPRKVSQLAPEMMRETNEARRGQHEEGKDVHVDDRAAPRGPGQKRDEQIKGVPGGIGGVAQQVVAAAEKMIGNKGRPPAEQM